MDVMIDMVEAEEDQDLMIEIAAEEMITEMIEMIEIKETIEEMIERIIRREAIVLGKTTADVVNPDDILKNYELMCQEKLDKIN